jgi:hypothetical protein
VGWLSWQVRQGSWHLVTHTPAEFEVYPSTQTAQTLLLHSLHLSGQGEQTLFRSWSPLAQAVQEVMLSARQSEQLYEHPLQVLLLVIVKPFLQVMQVLASEQLKQFRGQSWH